GRAQGFRRPREIPRADPTCPRRAAVRAVRGAPGRRARRAPPRPGPDCRRTSTRTWDSDGAYGRAHAQAGDGCRRPGSSAPSTAGTALETIADLLRDDGERPGSRGGGLGDDEGVAASGPGNNPAMFSTRPRIDTFSSRATVIDWRTTSCETSDGIVTMTTPASTGTSETTVASRSVPGGRSMTSASSSPQAVSAR